MTNDAIDALVADPGCHQAAVILKDQLNHKVGAIYIYTYPTIIPIWYMDPLPF